MCDFCIIKGTEGVRLYMTSGQQPARDRKPEYLKGSAGLHSMEPLTQDDRGTDVYPIVPPQTHIMPKYVGGQPKPVRAGQTFPDDEGFALEGEVTDLDRVGSETHPVIGLVMCLMLCITATIIAYWATH